MKRHTQVSLDGSSCSIQSLLIKSLNIDCHTSKLPWERFWTLLGVHSSSINMAMVQPSEPALHGLHVPAMWYTVKLLTVLD